MRNYVKSGVCWPQAYNYVNTYYLCTDV